MEDTGNNLQRIVIVTPVHNRRDITVQSLRSLSRIKSDGFDVRIVVVDDGSTDGTSDAITENFHGVEIVKGDGTLWFTGGTNRGIEAALKHDPDFILTINDDSIFDENFLKRLVQCAEDHPRSVVGPLLLLWDQPHRVFQVSPKWSVLSGGYRHWQHQKVWTVPDQPWEVELIVGNCILFPVDAIRECGLMNEKSFPHYGDAEYTPRMKKHGWRLLIEPRARVFCQPNDPPPTVRKMSPKKMLWTLIWDLGNANSLRRRFLANLYGAPNKAQGLLAFPVFWVRYLAGRNLEGDYAQNIREEPLTSIFADKIVRR
jgi:glycosyltransferase involved in cell wall biosynthesis